MNGVYRLARFNKRHRPYRNKLGNNVLSESHQQNLKIAMDNKSIGD